MHLSPLQTVRCYYESLAPGRRAELMDLLDPHVVLELPDGFPGGGGTYVGLKAYVEDFLYNFYGTFDLGLHPSEFYDAGETIIVLGRAKGLAIASGVPVDVPFTHVWTIRNSHLIRGRMFTDTACLCQAAGALTSNR